MTIMSAAKEVSSLGDNADMQAICKAISSGSLRGARGNSGVILSQLLRGFTKIVKEHNELNVTILSEAFDKAVVYRTPTFGLDGVWMSNNNNNIDFNSFELNDERFGGVSMFVPQYPAGYYSKYNNDIKKTGWYYAAGLDALGW